MLVALIPLAGCYPKKVKPVDPEDATRTIVDTRATVYRSTAINPEKSAALTGALIAIGGVLLEGLVDKGFDAAAAALQKAAGNEALASANVKTSGYLLARNGTAIKETASIPEMPNAIAIIHGTFGETEGNTSPSTDFVLEAQKKLNSSYESLIVVTQIEYSKEMSAMRLVPKYLLFNGGLAGKKRIINLGINYTFRVPVSPEPKPAPKPKPKQNKKDKPEPASDAAEQKPNPKMESTAFGSTSLTFNRLGTATILDDKALDGKQTEWIPVPKLEDSEYTKLLPVTVEIQIVETKEANELIKIMAEAFDSKKDDMKKEANAIIKIVTG